MFVGLTIAGVPFASVIALACGVGEVIPVVGAWISGITAAVITLAVSPDKAIWVLLIFIAVKALIDFILLPRMQAASLDLHPALVIMLLVIGPFVAGFWGLLLVVPLTAIVVKLYQYVHQAAVAEDAADAARLERHPERTPLALPNALPELDRSSIPEHTDGVESHPRSSLLLAVPENVLDWLLKKVRHLEGK